MLLPRLKEINPATPLPVALGMVSHIDDDHINGIQKLTAARSSTRGPAIQPPVKFARFWFNSFDKLVGPKPAGRGRRGGHGLAAVACQRDEPAGRRRRACHADHAERWPGQRARRRPQHAAD